MLNQVISYQAHKMSTNKDFVKQSDEHCLVLYLNKVKSAVDNMWIKAAMENKDMFARLNAALAE